MTCHIYPNNILWIKLERSRIITAKHALKENWSKEADVVIIGYGAAGATAAITAHDAGAKVLILEKAPESEVGGNTRVSLQLWLSPFPVEQFIIYFNALCGAYTVMPEIASVWAKEMVKNTD